MRTNGRRPENGQGIVSRVGSSPTSSAGKQHSRFVQLARASVLHLDGLVDLEYEAQP